MTSRAVAEGYRRKPHWIYVVGAVFVLTPFGNLLVTLASLNIPRWYLPATWVHWLRYVPSATWVLMAFICLSGCSLLLFVRRWALILTMFTLGVVIAHNVLFIQSFSLMGSMAVTTMIATTSATSYFIYFTRFRRPYTDPKIRWWETSPRYRVEIQAKIEGVTPDPTLTDISLTGAMIVWPDLGQRPAAALVTHLMLPPGLRLPCVVARETLCGFGVKFTAEDGPTRKRFKHWIKQLGRDPAQIYW